MSQNGRFSLPQSRRHERGQVIIWLVMVWAVFFILMAAVVADLGVVYCAYRQLQASTDAAALAGAAVLPSAASSSTVQTQVTQYGSYTGGRNIYTDMTVPNAPAMNLKCASTLGVGCVTLSGATANALTVTQKATVPLNFMNFFSTQLGGQPTLPITASSMAAMRGAPPGPFNVIVITDATGSMASSEDSGDCNNLRLVCALEGIQVFLQDLEPCPVNITCAFTGQNAANPIDEVGLMIFPGVAPTGSSDPQLSTDYAVWEHPYEYDNSASTPSSSMAYTSYGTPTATPLTATQLADYEKEYQIVELSSDYRVSDATLSLNTSSDIVKAVSNPVQNGRILYETGPGSAPGLSDLAGENTFYAGALYAAYAELAAHPRTGAQSVIVLLSDGDANADSSKFNTTGASPIVKATGTGTYPSYKNECQQAVTAATYIKSQTIATFPVVIYVVAYGASNSAGGSCSTDNGAISACAALQQIATSSEQFYSDTVASQNQGQCLATVNNTTNNLNQIFGAIAGSFSHARLIPVGTQ